MGRKDRIDTFGATALILLALLFAINQISIKILNGGFQPVFAAALRSVLSALCIWLWMYARGIPVTVVPGTARLGVALGVLFSVEFTCLFVALDLTTVTRTTVILYSMPVWLAAIAHFLIPGERITPRRALGLALAFGGMARAITDRSSLPEGGDITGDLLALVAAIGWAAVAFIARKSSERGTSPEMQLLWMVGVSAPLLMLAAPAFGPLLRDPGPAEYAALLFQAVVVVAGGFLAWFWLLARYPSSGVASFSFLSPIFGIALGWALLGEPVSPALLLAGGMVATGLLLINWPRRGQVPQKVRRTR